MGSDILTSIYLYSSNCILLNKPSTLHNQEHRSVSRNAICEAVLGSSYVSILIFIFIFIFIFVFVFIEGMKFHSIWFPSFLTLSSFPFFMVKLSSTFRFLGGRKRRNAERSKLHLQVNIVDINPNLSIMRREEDKLN